MAVPGLIRFNPLRRSLAWSFIVRLPKPNLFNNYHVSIR
jgi:hypothetical protein